MSLLVAPEQGSTKNAMARIVARFEYVLEPARGFFLKPNIVFPVTPDTGEITRPSVLRSLMEALRERFGDVDIVGERTAAGTVAQENFEISGPARLCKEMSVELVDLDSARRERVPWRYGLIELPEAAFRRIYINMPILKMSTAAVLSGAIWNQKGLIISAMKKKFHRMGLDEPVAALTATIQPQLTILDCVNFLKRRNVFVAGERVYEIDALAIRVLNCEEPEYFKDLSKARFSFERIVGGEGFIGSGWSRHRAD